jgi:hypothetical protein
MRSKTLFLETAQEKGGHMTQNKNAASWRWQPPKETIDAIATVMSTHWIAAKSRPAELFWQRPQVWTQQLSKLTTSRPEADSSDTLPDPHPC